MLPRATDDNLRLVITPAGEKSLDTKLRKQAGKGARDIIRAFHLIRLDLKQQAFGLTFGHVWLLLEPALQAGVYYFLLTINYCQSAMGNNT